MDLIFELHSGVVCTSCGTKLFGLFDYHGKPIANYEKYVQDLQAGVNDEFVCSLCEDHIQIGQNFHKLTVPYDVTWTLIDIIGSDIQQCEHCMSAEMPFIVDTGIFGRSVGEYLHEAHVPDELIPAITDLVNCKCGYGREPATGNNPEAGIFKQTDEVFTNRDFLLGFDGKKFFQFAKKYNVTIFEDDLLDFKNHLKKSPLFGSDHPVGNAIYKILEEHFKHENYTVVKQGEQTLYRGRAHDSLAKQFEYHQLGAAPLGKSSHGRYNAIGVPVFYASDQKEAIPYELRPKYNQSIDIGTFQITKKEFKLFDIGHFDSHFIGFFNEITLDESNFKESYLLPNFIGACCNKIGYDGVVYKGVHEGTSKISYTNYALFNMEIELDLTPSAKVETYDLTFNISMQKREVKKNLEHHF